ncbi:MAG: hypothetical protein EOP08_06325 [Proteobacteria bacterium]|nr:MAG: hypothetical protein EOP08_06325 [Pseudomonadota bacterium]
MTSHSLGRQRLPACPRKPRRVGGIPAIHKRERLQSPFVDGHTEAKGSDATSGRRVSAVSSRVLRNRGPTSQRARSARRRPCGAACRRGFRLPRVGRGGLPAGAGHARTMEARCVLARIQAWCLDVACTPGSGLVSAIDYMSKRCSRATLFLEHPDVRLDNNAAERAIRGVVLGRKNHYGSRSQRGTEVAAVSYSLIESAKLVGVESAEFLRRAAEAALAGGEPIVPVDLAPARE